MKNFPFFAERQARKLRMLIFIVFRLTRPGIELNLRLSSSRSYVTVVPFT